MILRKYWTEEADTITVEFEDGEPVPEENDVIYLDGQDDQGVRVGQVLYNKYNVMIYKVIEAGIPGSYDDL